MKTADLVQEYGGIEELISDVKYAFDFHNELYASEQLETILYALKDYKRLKAENKKLKKEIEKLKSDKAWPTPASMQVGDRNEMGG